MEEFCEVFIIGFPFRNQYAFLGQFEDIPNGFQIHGNINASNLTKES
jgi:hypothetical protein